MRPGCPDDLSLTTRPYDVPADWISALTEVRARLDAIEQMLHAVG